MRGLTASWIDPRRDIKGQMASVPRRLKPDAEKLSGKPLHSPPIW